MAQIVYHENLSTPGKPKHRVKIQIPLLRSKVGVGSTPFKAFINAITR